MHPQAMVNVAHQELLATRRSLSGIDGNKEDSTVSALVGGATKSMLAKGQDVANAITEKKADSPPLFLLAGHTVNIATAAANYDDQDYNTQGCTLDTGPMPSALSTDLLLHCSPARSLVVFQFCMDSRTILLSSIGTIHCT